jgi:hypothetical protein
MQEQAKEAERESAMDDLRERQRKRLGLSPAGPRRKPDYSYLPQEVREKYGIR